MAYSADSFTAGEVPTTAKWNKLWSNDADFDTRVSQAAPVGVINPYGGSTAPTGWLLCDGSAVSRTTYAALFAILGTTYGAGNGSTTFNLPDLRGKIPVGRDSGQTEFDVLGETGGAKTQALTQANLPSGVTGTIGMHNSGTATNVGSASGVFSATNTLGAYVNGGTGGSGPTSLGGFTFNLGGSGTDHNNLQPYQVINYIVKI